MAGKKVGKLEGWEVGRLEGKKVGRFGKPLAELPKTAVRAGRRSAHGLSGRKFSTLSREEKDMLLLEALRRAGLVDEEERVK